MAPPFEFLAILNILLSALTGTVAAVLAYMFYLGLRYSKKDEGRHIMRAIIWVWLAISIHQYTGLLFNIRIAAGEVEVSELHYWLNIPANMFLTLASLYYLWATVRRNPPTNNGQLGNVREALDDRLSR
jgi:hypothetical protein